MFGRRIILVWIVALGAIAWGAADLHAAVFHGKVVSAAAGVLMIKNQPQRIIPFTIAPYARIVRNGKVVPLEHLRIRDDVIVWTDQSGMVAIAVEASSWRGS